MYEYGKLVATLRDPKLKEERLARIEEIEDRLSEKVNEVAEIIVNFGDIHPDATEPPKEWVAAYGKEGAEKRLRVMQSAWLPAKEAPVALRLITQMKTGIDRARAHKVSIQNNTINVQMLKLPAPTSKENPGSTVYEVIDMEDDR